jgi:hypothetical protein
MQNKETPILTFKNCQITDIKIDKLDVAVFKGSYAEKNSVKYPKITIKLLNQPNIYIEPTTDGYYCDAYGFTRPSQILIMITKFAAEHRIKQLPISRLIKYLIENCDHDGCLNIQIGDNNKKLILPYSGLPSKIDYRFPIIQEFFKNNFKTVWMKNTDITSKINFNLSTFHKSDILNHQKLLIAKEPKDEKLHVYEENWTVIDEFIKI